MGIAHGEGIESTAALFHHPLHPIAVTLPIGSLVGVLACDLTVLATRQPFWTTAAFWLLWAGIVTGLAAASLGAIDYFAITQVRRLRIAHVHAGGNVVAIGLAVANLVVHWVVPGQHVVELVLSVVTVAVLGGTGWLGGLLSHKHRIGQIAPAHGGRIPRSEPGGLWLR